MRPIGRLNSPYVRRVAVRLQLLGLPFEHRPDSAFGAFDEFHATNPVVKAPSLVCADGTVLMDSTLILDYAEKLAQLQGRRSRMPADLPGRQADLRVIGRALAACEKRVQIISERGLRPPERQHEPWVERVTGQLLAAFATREDEVARRPLADSAAHLSQAGVTTAVSWYFTQAMLPQIVPAARFATLAAFSARSEKLAAFSAAAHGDGSCRPG